MVCGQSYICSHVYTVNNSDIMDEGCAIGQMVRHWFLTMKPWFKFQVTSCHLVNEVRLEQVFFVNYLPSNHFSLAAYSSEVCDSHD